MKFIEHQRNWSYYHPARYYRDWRHNKIIENSGPTGFESFATGESSVLSEQMMQQMYEFMAQHQADMLERQRNSFVTGLQNFHLEGEVPVEITGESNEESNEEYNLPGFHTS